MPRINEILKKNQLSVTETRKKILSFFMQSEAALAHADIEKLSDNVFDRVTIYRTLQTFVEKGIIHSIPTTDNSVRYALCKDDCEAGSHNDDHVHFFCDTCGNMYCMEHTSIPDIHLPAGFIARQTDVLINGLCKNCS